MTVEIMNIDCMEYMVTLEDNAFNLAICDPPYGININMNIGIKAHQKPKHCNKKWDLEAPGPDYFNELRRVSAHQIIWGANNFSWIPPHSGGVVWDKDITGGVPFSKAEMAYNSTIKVMDLVRIRAYQKYRIHPTQKPVRLYQWLLRKYAKAGDKILDTHLGSGSSAIAAYYEGFDFVGCELDAEYYEASLRRLKDTTSQQAMGF